MQGCKFIAKKTKNFKLKYQYPKYCKHKLFSHPKMQTIMTVRYNSVLKEETEGLLLKMRIDRKKIRQKILLDRKVQIRVQRK